MVQPYPADLDDSPKDIQTNKTSRYFNASNVAFLAMCGWTIRNHIPTNTTLRQTGFCAFGAGAGCVAAIAAGTTNVLDCGDGGGWGLLAYAYGESRTGITP